MEPGSSDEGRPLPPEDARGGRHYGVPRLRERVLQKLAEAYSQNNLDLDEYERRVKRAQEARTIEQLQEVLADFEGPGAETLSPRTAAADRAEVFFALIGDREVTAEELPAHAVNAFTVIGDLRIDLSSLREGEVYTVNSVSIIGDTRLLVPPGAAVVRQFFTVIGDFKRKKDRQAPPGPSSCTVILKGFKIIGDVIVTEAGAPRK